MPLPKLTPEQRVQLVEDIRHGLRSCEGVKKYGITTGSWSYYVKKARTTDTKQSARRSELLNKIRALSKQGLTHKEIAKQLGLKKSMPGYYLTRYGHGQSENGAKPKRAIKPIVLDMAKEEANHEERLERAIELLWARLGLEEKLRAVEAIDRREE